MASCFDCHEQSILSKEDSNFCFAEQIHYFELGERTDLREERSELGDNERSWSRSVTFELTYFGDDRAGQRGELKRRTCNQQWACENFWIGTETGKIMKTHVANLLAA